MTDIFKKVRGDDSKDKVPVYPIEKMDIDKKSRDELRHPTGAVQYQLPLDANIEASLANVELLMRRGDYGEAMERARRIEVKSTTICRHQYRILVTQAIARIQLRVAEQYHVSGDFDKARDFYEQAISTLATGELTSTTAKLVQSSFEKLVDNRSSLLQELVRCAQSKNMSHFEGNSPTKRPTSGLGKFAAIQADLNECRISTYSSFVDKGITRDIVLPMANVVQEPFPCMRFATPRPGVINRVAFEKAGLDRNPTSTPGSTFPVDSHGGAPSTVSVAIQSPMQATVAMPIAEIILHCKWQLMNLENKLDVEGVARGMIPVFRYEYLYKKAKDFVKWASKIEKKMIPLRMRLDDFDELAPTMARQIEEKTSELNTINARISELMGTLTSLSTALPEVEKICKRISDFQSSHEWWEVVTGILARIPPPVAAAIATYVPPTLMPADGRLEVTNLSVGGMHPVRLDCGAPVTTIFANRDIDNKSFEDLKLRARNVLSAVRESIEITQAEVHSLFCQRDVVECGIGSMQLRLEEVYKGERTKVLNSLTCNSILQCYEDVRRTLITRATLMAKRMEQAWNCNTDTPIAVIKHTYHDGILLPADGAENKGYTAVERLLRDLEEFDFLTMCSKQSRPVEVRHTVSLSCHRPLAFAALKLSGGCTWETTMSELDRVCPGVFMQRLKEVNVEVVLNTQVVPVQGCLTNFGTSETRFRSSLRHDEEGMVEFDKDVSDLGFKRLRRPRHQETMVFPVQQAVLYNERRRKNQRRVAPHFENVGPETMWKLEILPNQPYDMSMVTDVRIIYQYECLFDETLRSVIEKKRFSQKEVGDTAIISIPNLMATRGSSVVTGSKNIMEFTIDPLCFQYPQIEKRIRNIGFMVRAKPTAVMGQDVGSHPMVDYAPAMPCVVIPTMFTGPAKLEVGFGNDKVQLVTDERGVVATGSRGCGEGYQDLSRIAIGKNVCGKFHVTVSQYPTGIDPNHVEVLMIVSYDFHQR